VQTFFTAGSERYFTVDYEEGEGRQVGSSLNTQEAVDVDEGELSGLLSDFSTLQEKWQKELEIADASVAKTDHTGWFNKNQWPEHLKNCNLRHLSRASRLPDRDEELFRKAVEINSALIERCVGGLSTLDNEIRRWLRSAKQSEPDVRPFARLQNPSGQERYANYFARLICYALRVLESEETRASREEESLISSDSDDNSSENNDSDSGSEDSSDSQQSNAHLQLSTDVLKDARRLFPWQGEQRDLLKKFRSALNVGAGEEATQDALLEFYRSIIFQRVRGDTFVSILLHYCAVLGIDGELFRLRRANDFSYMLAGLLYCIRVFAVEILLPSAERDKQGMDDDKRFRKERDEFLADGSLSVMSKMLSMLAYSKHIAMNHSNAGAVFWSDDRSVMTYKGNAIGLEQFSRFARDIVGEAEEKLWSDVLKTTKDERFSISLETLKDDVTFTKRGMSFINHKQNGLSNKQEWLLRRFVSEPSRWKLRMNGRWMKGEVRRYLRTIDRFRELLLLSIHICGGQPARGSEITAIRFRNGFMQDRNVFVVHGQVIVVTRYHKSQSQFDKPKVIPRFLPWRVGQVLAVYLAYVQPVQEFLVAQINDSGPSDYLWANEHGPWETDRLTRALSIKTSKQLGVRLTTHNYRHVAISVGREVIGAAFAKGYQEGMDEYMEEEEEEGDEDALEVSAGRGGEIGTNRYGVPMDVIQHLSNKTVDTFRPLSMKWHSFLGLKSTAGTGQKRGSHERGVSVEEDFDRQHSERRSVVSAQHSILSQLRSITAQYKRSCERIGISGETGEEGDEDAWYFGDSNSNGEPKSSPLAHRLSSSVGRMAQLPSPLSNVDVERSQRSVTRTLFPQERPAPVSDEQVRKAMQKALQIGDVSFRSEEQREALYAVINAEQASPLVVVLPTGGGKSLLFMAPACLEDAGVTIVVVPYRALINNLVKVAQAAGIDSIEWRPGERNPAALVFVSADLVAGGTFLGYAQLLGLKRLLRRVFVDESHLTFTSSDWRPKLAHVREVRKLPCPTIMLTATLPVILEGELEAAMAAELSRYIRATTTRIHTRYIVHEVKRGKLVEEAIGLCRRVKKYLGFRRGVVYSRSRKQCEEVAAELGCAYYHAAAVDNEERLAAWLEYGGLIVATSALGTGVDFPGIVFVLHVDVPYGMIDFGQESGRAGRAGEDVDSVIVVEQGRVEGMAAKMQSIDETVMGEFVATKGCRRMIMSEYLDGRTVECSSDLARCDRCGEGVTAMFRAHSQAASERQAFEEEMDELRDTQGCLDCFVYGTVDAARRDWGHEAGECVHGKDGEGVAFSEEDVEGFRSKMRFDKRTHSCFKCGISQKVCKTGENSSRKCQWPRIMAGILRRVGCIEGGRSVIQRCGFEGEWGDWDGYAGWLGQAHGRRVWGEVVSRGMVVLKEFLSWRRRIVEQKEGVDLGSDLRWEDQSSEETEVGLGFAEGESEERVQETDEEHEDGGKVRVMIEKLRSWEGRCMICERSGHVTERCVRDAHLAGMMQAGVEQMERMGEPACEQGRCWVGWVRCERVNRKCRWSGLAGRVGIGLLYVGKERERVQEWVSRVGEFAGETEQEGLEALERVFKGEVEWERGVQSNMLCEMIWRFG
jgi:superfamily II DNA or RNA helicase